MKPVDIEEFNQMVGDIYDCAVDPDLWVPTMTKLRDRLGWAYCQINYMDTTYHNPENNSGAVTFQTEWPQIWNEVGPRWVPQIPGVERWFSQGIDESISQMQCIDEEEFRQLPIFLEFVKPQNLIDFCHTTFAKRENTHGSIGAARYDGTGLFSEDERNLLRLLSPHFRRSLAISGMIDEGRVRTRLFSGILDKLSAGIIIASEDGRPAYANETAEVLLSKGEFIHVRHGRLTAASMPHNAGLQASIKAASKDDASIGNFGNGIPLPGKDGSSAVAYVLPLGKSDHRRTLGPGLAALFISPGGLGVPPPVEVLSALCGLTSQQARVALMVADGETLQNTADRLGISINTVRTHLASVFQKTDTNSQQALMKFISGLSLPVQSTQTP